MGSEHSPEESAARFGGAPDWYLAEHPRHTVRITRPFAMSATQITRGQFRAFVQATDYRTAAEIDGYAEAWSETKFAKTPGVSWRDAGFEQSDDHPVVCVTWDDAVAFCQWLSQSEGQNHRLPTEAEWEYAYRAGQHSAYTWGDDPNAGQGWANCADLTAKKDFADWTTFNWTDGFVFTAPVASFKPNHWGLYDMAGNAWQWCGDWFGPYSPDEVSDPMGPALGEKRVLRGGSWYGAPMSCRATYRSKIVPTYRGTNVGFRLVREIS
jgi:formylglycine-generating enzyme required for sulfatase activity